MDPIVIAAFIALIGAIVGPIISYRIATRRLSGQVATSDASDLWTAQTVLREDLMKDREWAQSRIRSLTEEIDRLTKRMSVLEERNASLAMTIAEQREEILNLKAELLEAQQENHLTVAKLKDAEERLDRTRRRVKELEEDELGPMEEIPDA